MGEKGKEHEGGGRSVNGVASPGQLSGVTVTDGNTTEAPRPTILPADNPGFLPTPSPV